MPLTLKQIKTFKPSLAPELFDNYLICHWSGYFRLKFPLQTTYDSTSPFCLLNKCNQCCIGGRGMSSPFSFPFFRLLHLLHQYCSCITIHPSHLHTASSSYTPYTPTQSYTNCRLNPTLPSSFTLSTSAPFPWVTHRLYHSIVPSRTVSEPTSFFRPRITRNRPV
ncbi:hypothetical protein BDP27DRAFT_159348 [Rhodocollybia butyracea]|uniref:Uncharacterized protein n=1 Tax=Rhodocollybia butyracea TaxID=206335 RepID=A0A9P5U487_9AGAR|nr:hypothetical protein BDP27DRAFT_159348 [Rhodocollybia butyracea]